MIERCGCGADLIADVPMCLACGARRPAPRVLAAVGAPGRPGPAPLPRPIRPAPVRVVARPVAPMPVPPMPAPMPMPLQVPAAPARSSSAPWIVASAAIVVLTVVGALIVVVMMRPTSSGAQPAPIVATAPAPVTVTVAPSTSSSSSSSAGGGAASLQAVVDADRNAMEGFDGMWVPQLSSKRSGTVDNGTTYDASSIYAHYESLVSGYTNVRMLWSGDWSVYRESDYWVVVAGEGFTSAAGANAWCDARGFSADDCFAKRLSHTAGPAGTTELRSS